MPLPRTTFRTLFFAGVLCVLAAAALSQPQIGLVYRADRATKFRAGELPLQRCRSALEENGAEVVPLTILDGWNDLNEALLEIDGLLVPGGGDVDPKFYSEAPHETLAGVDAELDRFEFFLLDNALSRDLPVLGICRGHQVLNVFLGGSLVQDIPSQIATEGPVIHRYPKDSTVPREHSVSIEEGTILHNVLGSSRVVVSTYHHQAVKTLGRGLLVTARSDDGVVEGIECPEAAFVVGVQFHPERQRADERFDALFRRFVEEAARAAGTQNRSESAEDEDQTAREQESAQ
ncbi:MAG: gamma-glutamyl-gamma-aminobutyrate hydrolase family protein [bacterium]|nr:gamma-glutamyl-gamma-aminobutyrate hydrolase family protein [bacterium]